MNNLSFSIPVPRLHGRIRQSHGRLQRLTDRLRGFVLTGYHRYRQRRALAQLDARLLRDIGVTPMQAEQESGKPFWRE